MIQNFTPLHQEPGSNSCLPTCVRAVLQWQDHSISQGDVSDWCGESILGCLWSDALAGLDDAGFTVDELRGLSGPGEDDLAELRAIVQDEDAPQPVIVTVQEPFRDQNGDHVVVLLGFTVEDADQGAEESIVYMDPLSGALERDTAEHFLRCWRQADKRAFTVSP